MDLLHFFASFYTLFFVWLSAIAAAFVAAKKNPLRFRLFAGLVILLAITETVANILAFHKIKNHFIFNLSDGALFYGAAWFFYSSSTLKNFRRAVMAFLIVYPVFFLADNIFIQGFFTFNTYSYLFGGAFILAVSAAYLWELYLSDETRSIFSDPVFWFSIAFLFYCGVSLPFIGMMNYLWDEFPVFTRQYYISIYEVSIIIYNLVLTAGFICTNLFMRRS